MKAMVITAFGGPEVFQEAELPTPQPGPSELLVHVKATSVNPVDYKIRQAGSWAQVQPPAVIGYDAA
ncbi:MAG: NADPH:quinone oxidoreductase, partial [Anaerolineae bacterium]|nr:NADPH:quinone oxidoreductase [Anaerolineae bacterium]